LGWIAGSTDFAASAIARMLASAMPLLTCLHDELAFFGGGEQMLLRVAALARRHSRTDLGVLWGAGALAVDPAALREFEQVAQLDFPAGGIRPSNALLHRRAAHRLHRWLQSRGASGVLAFGLRSALYAAPLARRSSIPLAWMCQEGFPLYSSRSGKAKQWMIARFLSRAGTQIVCATDQACRALEGLGLPPARLHRIRNGVDVARFTAARMSEQEKRQWRASHGLPRGDLTAVCVARLDPIKDHPVLLKAVRAAGRSGVRVVLVCVGAASVWPAYAARLRALAEGLGVASQVIWTGHQDDVRPWLGMADVAALSSLRECASLALAEAGACGLPLVGSNAGGIPEIVRDGVTGFLFEPGDAEGCAAALVRLAGDPDRRLAMGERLRELVRSELDAAVCDLEWARFLDRLLGRAADG
jgi:glycosyltransferase involved in cell wall biosynthesis